jgi:lipopolysaccharide transport system ATP-binding protein
MSDDVVIRVENLGKKYRIRHNAERQRYTALRDVIAHKLKAPFQFLRRSQKSEVRSQTSDLRPPTSARTSSEDFWALRDVSFEVKQGEVVGIIGRNGAGKSTLLKILSRITEPTTGRIRIMGRVASLLEVGTGFHPELTGRENIFLNGAILGMHRAEIKQKFDEIVAFAEVEKFLDTPVKRYSSGMYMRLAFAVAAHLEPEILLVDEVLAVGDAQFQEKCLGKMQDVSKGGRTVLFVSHNMATMRRLCKLAVLLDQGRTVSIDSVETVINRYLTSSIGEGSSGPLDSFAHAINTGEFSIKEVTLFNCQGIPTGNFQTSEPITVLLHFEVHSHVRDLRVGIGINSSDGRRISTVHHTNSGLLPFDGQPGNYQLSFEYENPLLAGSYIISVGAHRILGGQTVDYVPEAVRFHIVPTSLEDENVSYTSGFVRSRGNWTLPPLIGKKSETP